MNSGFIKMLCRMTALGACLSSSVCAFDVDDTSNAVFDLYYFTNGESGVFGTLKGDGFDQYKLTGGTVADASTYYWSTELKQAMVNAVNTWTTAIATPYDTTNNARKLRIGFFLDDGSTGGVMKTSMAGYAATQTVASNSDPKYGSTANLYSVAEWAWRENNETANYNPTWASGYYHWETNILSSGESNIDIAIVLNPVITSISTGPNGEIQYVKTARTAEEMQNIATHEIGHGMGMDSQMYTQKYDEQTAQNVAVLSGNVSTWDTLLMLDGEHIVTVDEKGNVLATYATLEALHAAGWECAPGKDPSDSGSYTGTEIQYDPDRQLSLEGKVGVHIDAYSMEGDTMEHLSYGDGKNVLGPGGTANSSFSESDLLALELLGWSINRSTTIPEPTTATLSLLALCALAARRRRK